MPAKYPAATALLLGLVSSARAGGEAADRRALRAGVEAGLQLAEAEFISSNPLMQEGRGMPVPPKKHAARRACWSSCCILPCADFSRFSVVSRWFANAGGVEG